MSYRLVIFRQLSLHTTKIIVKTIKKLPHSLLLATAVLCTTYSHGAIVLVAEYHLGEAGSLAAGSLRPQDSSGLGTPSGLQHMDSNTGSGSATVGTAGVYAPGSTAYLDTSSATDYGWYDNTNAFAGTLAIDNFAFGIYASAAGLGSTEGTVFSIGGVNGSFMLNLTSTGWGASVYGGPSIGSSGSFTANQWVHLALVRTSGITTFYVDGAAQGSTYAVAPTYAHVHISVNPFATGFYDGLLDEGRIVTFDAADAGAGDINVLNALQAVPESSTALLAIIGVLPLLRRRR